jgi:hypothetical protein
MFIVEDNIDFYSEINNDEEISQDNICLITQNILDTDHIALECGHKFNYEAIYNDIINHKTKFNKLEKTFLTTNEIRCPYCRNIQDKLLPENNKFPKIHGVNYFDDYVYLSNLFKNYNDKWVKGQCMFYNEVTDNEKSNCCINTNVTYIKTFNLFLCNQHKNIYIKNYLMIYDKEQKDKEKKEKILLKEQKKQELIEMKKSIPLCSSINKNKKQCCYKSVKEGLCTRHYKLLNNTSI